MKRINLKEPQSLFVRAKYPLSIISITFLSLTLLTSCSGKILKKKEPTCRDYQLQYDYHNGEATLWSARDKRAKAEGEMMEVVKIVMGNPGCFPEKIIQDIQYYYTTLPGVTTYNNPEDDPRQ